MAFPEHGGASRRGAGRRPNLLSRLGVGRVHHLEPEILKHFVAESGKILPRRLTGVTAAQQRALARAIKRARVLALLPFARSKGGP